MDVYDMIPSGRINARINPFIRSPNRRFVGAFREDNTFLIVDKFDATVSAVHQGVDHRCVAIHSDGQRIAVRTETGIEVRHPDHGVLARSFLDTGRVSFGGDLLGPDDPLPYWGLSQELVSFVGHQSEGLILTTHNREGKATVFAWQMDDKSLHLVDTLSNLRALPEEGALSQLSHWGGEGWVELQERDPTLLFGVHNAGDSLGGVVALQWHERRLSQIAPQELPEAVFNLTSERLLDMKKLSDDSLLVMDRDMLLTRVPWPLSSEHTAQWMSPLEELRDDEYDIVLPWKEPIIEERSCMWLDSSPGISLGSQRLFVNIHGSFVNLNVINYVTVAVVVLDPYTFRLQGLFRRPKLRLSYDVIEHLGDEIFAAVGDTWSMLLRAFAKD